MARRAAKGKAAAASGEGILPEAEGASGFSAGQAVTESGSIPEAVETERKEETDCRATGAGRKESGLPFEVRDGRVRVVSKQRAGKKITARTGEVISFDAEGKTTVRVDDALYLSKCPGISFE